jgi:hypothetical protein
MCAGHRDSLYLCVPALFPFQGDLLRVERILLDALEFNVTGPTAYAFLHLLTQVGRRACVRARVCVGAQAGGGWLIACPHGLGGWDGFLRVQGDRSARLHVVHACAKQLSRGEVRADEQLCLGVYTVIISKIKACLALCCPPASHQATISLTTSDVNSSSNSPLAAAAAAAVAATSPPMEVVVSLAMYLTELALLDQTCLIFPGSHLATAALLLAHTTLRGHYQVGPPPPPRPARPPAPAPVKDSEGCGLAGSFV